MVTPKEMAELEAYLKEMDKQNNHDYPTEMLRKFVGVYEQNKDLASRISSYEAIKDAGVFLSNYREICCFAEEILDSVDTDCVTPSDIQDCIMLVGNAIDDGMKICSEGSLHINKLSEVERAVLDLKEEILVELERAYDASMEVYNDRDIEMEMW